ncbi:MAG: hypothetical protein II695_09600 [Oscillospiraceae bacterium]|nr:hypothetical protein [Oscillospiraceae bacterium]
MNEEIEEIREDAEKRPPRDPKNGLYTFLSVLIFIAGTIIFRLVGDNITLVYALHEGDPGEQLKTAALRQLNIDRLPERSDVLYVRMHRNFDEDRLYLAVRLPDGTDEESFVEEYIPYQCGNPVTDERFAVYPEADAKAHYIFGDRYVSVDDPLTACIIYKENDETVAVFSSAEYDHNISQLFSAGKIAI